MKQTVSEHDFIDGFRIYNRENNFSYEGRQALFEYFEQLEEDIGEEFEYDPIAICCGYTEYEDEDEIREAYGLNDDEEISDYTHVIPVWGYDKCEYGGWIQIQIGIIVEDW
tara:strand:+ start:12781 stop:13113 length:333 start_codon:yes stop_codon:yes gene_type:complete